MDNTIPAVERTLKVLALLESSSMGLDATQLIERTDIPRTTLFRILRILAGHGYLQASSQERRAVYRLGPALGRLAARVPIADDLALLARPVLHDLSASIGETCKVVVRDGLESVTLAVQHSNAVGVTSRLGGRHPLNIGASQRLLLAHASEGVLEKMLAAPLAKRASGSISRPAALRESVRALRTKEWASGVNEGTEGVGTIAALVHEPHHELRAALVALYILGGRSEREVVRMRNAVIAAARELSAEVHRRSAARTR